LDNIKFQVEAGKLTSTDLISAMPKEPAQSHLQDELVFMVINHERLKRPFGAI